jgi:hypothetical protein
LACHKMFLVFASSVYACAESSCWHLPCLNHLRKGEPTIDSANCCQSVFRPFFIFCTVLFFLYKKASLVLLFASNMKKKQKTDLLQCQIEQRRKTHKGRTRRKNNKTSRINKNDSLPLVQRPSTVKCMLATYLSQLTLCLHQLPSVGIVSVTTSLQTDSCRKSRSKGKMQPWY